MSRTLRDRMSAFLREMWRRLTPGGRRLADRTSDELERKAESRRRANRRFDRHGPSETDLLPGGRYERKTGRRPGGWLERWRGR